MEQRERIERLLEQALDDFDTEGVSVSAIARKVQRIASLRQDAATEIWLILEMSTLEDTKLQVPALELARVRLANLIGAEEAVKTERSAVAGYFIRRSMKPGGDAFDPRSIPEIENGLSRTQGVYEELVVPAGLTPIDTYFVAEKMDGSRAKLLPDLQRSEVMLTRIKQALHDYLLSVEADLHLGKARADVFERARSYTNGALAKHAPDALEKFLASQDSLISGSSEDFAHALTSCRRVIKALADALFPPAKNPVTDINGIERAVTDDRYKNRLLEYVRQRVEPKRQRDIVLSIIEDLNTRLTALDGLSGKGVHGTVTANEAETCVVWTYMLAAEIMRIADGTSAQLFETGS